jgi:hypothetical protein
MDGIGHETQHLRKKEIHAISRKRIGSQGLMKMKHRKGEIKR